MTSASLAARRPGGISKKRATRTDRDGDLVMGRERTTAKKPARSITGTNAHKAILRHVGSNDTATRTRRNQPTSRGLEELRVTGWTNSDAASEPDGGVKALIAWLERKATMKTGSAKRAVKVKKSQVNGEELIISVPAEDVGALTRMNGFVWAKKNIKIERIEDAAAAHKENTLAMLKSVLARRYNAELKLLDLSTLGQDPDLKSSAVFDTASSTSKFFPALMKVLDEQFKTAVEKHEAIESVTLANNDLPDLKTVTTLSQTLPQLRNLDLSGNKLQDLKSIDVWKRRFRNLDQLIISNNPLEQAEPDYAKELVRWYPKLRMLNNIQVRADEEVAKDGSQAVDLPFPIRTANFQDEGQIAENFIRTFFSGFDTDRNGLALHYYDEQSDFSFAVNTSAPRDPAAVGSAAQEWDTQAHIKQSRNLKKISQLPARQNRHFRGPKAVQECWSHLPRTRHPDLATDAKKWLIECQAQPFVPDPSGQSPIGVDGFLITIHGEFDELDASTGEPKKKRSFDRSFVIGPGGPSGVRVVNDMLTIRAYGGAQAFEADNLEGWNTEAMQSQQPAGAPSTEQAQAMVLELQKRTNLTLQFAQECLEQTAWDFERALQAFAAVSTTLGPEYFNQG